MAIQCKADRIAQSSAEKADPWLLLAIDLFVFVCGAKKAELVPC